MLTGETPAGAPKRVNGTANPGQAKASVRKGGLWQPRIAEIWARADVDDRKFFGRTPGPRAVDPSRNCPRPMCPASGSSSIPMPRAFRGRCVQEMADGIRPHAVRVDGGRREIGRAHV